MRVRTTKGNVAANRTPQSVISSCVCSASRQPPLLTWRVQLHHHTNAPVTCVFDHLLYVLRRVHEGWMERSFLTSTFKTQIIFSGKQYRCRHMFIFTLKSINSLQSLFICNGARGWPLPGRTSNSSRSSISYHLILGMSTIFNDMLHCLYQYLIFDTPIVLFKINLTLSVKSLESPP